MSKASKIFCDKCTNILTVINKEGDLLFRCESCLTDYDSTPCDTLRYSRVFGHDDDIGMHYKLFRNVSQDPASPIIDYKCPSCGHKYARQVRIGKSMKIVNVCMKCEKLT